MDKYELFGYVRTKNDLRYVDCDGEEIFIPKGTLAHLVDMFEDGCIVEYCEHSQAMPDVNGYDYDDLEPVSEEEVGRIVKEEQRKQKENRKNENS